MNPCTGPYRKASTPERKRGERTSVNVHATATSERHKIMTDLSLLDATAQAELVRSGDASPLELVDAAIDRIEKLNGELNAVIHPLYERARAPCEHGLPDGPFTGVPIVVKDLDGTLAGAPYHARQQGAEGRGNTSRRTTSYLFAEARSARAS